MVNHIKAYKFPTFQQPIVDNKNQSGKNLLIISCSQRKKKLRGKVKAWDLYDGVIFRMLKKTERENGLPKNLDILILSAKHGFIRPSIG